MRVGILTFHHVLNYGALLQLFALQETLKNLGHDAIVVDVRKFNRNRHPLLGGYGIKSGHFLEFLKNKPSQCRKYNRFKYFRHEYLNLSKYHNSLLEFQNSKEMVDAFVVGSDQVWNDKYGRASILLYTLNGIKDDDTLNISYAASAGRANVDKEFFANPGFEKFDAISVRDTFTQNLVSQCSNRKSQIVLDPTLLIDWENISIKHQKVEIPTNYIFVYGFSKVNLALAIKVKKTYGYPLVGIPMEGDGYHPEIDYCIYDAGIGEWLNLIKYAKFVCTKSFHGMMLSIKYKKPFLVATGTSFSSDRLIDFAKRFNLIGQIVSNSDNVEIVNLIKSAEVIYKNLATELDVAINESKLFINNNLC